MSCDRQDVMSTNAFNETEIVHILASQLITVAPMADTPSFFDCIVSYVDHPNSGSAAFVVIENVSNGSLTVHLTDIISYTNY